MGASGSTQLGAPLPVATNVAPARVESIPLESVKKPEPVDTAPQPDSLASTPKVATPARIASAPAVASAMPQAKAAAPRAAVAPSAPTSVVAPLSSSQSPPAYGPARPDTDLQLHAETNVAQIRPDVIPPFPDSNTPPAASVSEASVLLALKSWSDAWAQGNADTYIAAYAPDFLPPGGDTHAGWEKRRRMLLGVAKNVQLRIESPKVKMTADGHALVTFNQYYHSKNYRDDLAKQIKLAQRDGGWLIIDEQIVSTLQSPKP